MSAPVDPSTVLAAAKSASERKTTATMSLAVAARPGERLLLVELDGQPSLLAALDHQHGVPKR